MSKATANVQVKIPLVSDVKAYFFENAVVGETERFRRLNRFEAHYLTTQYLHQPYDWWGLPADAAETISPSVQVPNGFTQPALNLLARQKRPTAPYHLAKAVVDRFTGLLFSETRKPDVEVEGDPDTDDFLHAAMEQMRFWARWREARSVGGSTGSALVTLHLRRGRFVMQCHNPKNVQVLWKDRRALEPLGVLIIYRYPQEDFVTDPRTGETTARVVDYLYRRIITDQDDTVYKPVKLEPGASLAWDVESEAEHRLGQFPGVWVQNKPVVEQEDGDPDCQGAWQSFDTIDRLLSQMNKALLLNLDPTLVLKIDPKELLAMGGTVRKGSDNALNVGTGDAKYLEMVASGVEAGHKLCDRLKQNVLDVTRCVLVDPEKLSGAAQSAKAMEYIYAPMLEQADELRSQWGDNGIIPMLRLIELMARKFHGVEATQGEQKVILQLDLPKKADGSVRKLGPGGWIRLKWGSYFSLTETDKQIQIGNIVSAQAGGIIDEETAVNAVAPIFGVQDAKAMLAKIRAEKAAQSAMGMGPEYGGEPTVEPNPAEPAPPDAGQGGKP